MSLIDMFDSKTYLYKSLHLDHRTLDKYLKIGDPYLSRFVFPLNPLQNNLSDKIKNLLSIKNNKESFLKYNNTSESTYYLEDILKLIILNIKDNNKKDTANNLLKKLNLLKKSLNNKNKTPILSSYLKQIIPLFINNLEINNNISYELMV